jgi:hypothetical protein
MPQIDFDVDVDDFVSACSRREINELIEELDYHGYINKETVISQDRTIGLMEKMFLEKMSKLSSCYYRLTPEEEKTLETLFKKYV